MQGAVTSPLNMPVMALRGVGTERTAQLARLQIHNVRELLLYRPRRHEDRREVRRIDSVAKGETVAVCGTIVALGVKTWRFGQRSVFECVVEDGTARLHCRWWNMPYLQNYYHSGESLFVYGRVTSVRPRAMDHPETENVEIAEEASIHLRRVVPIYPLTEGITQRWLRALIHHALCEYALAFDNPGEAWRPPGGQPASELLRRLHFPEEPADAEHSRRQLALAELVVFQRELWRRRRQLQAHAARSCSGDNSLMRPFLRRLEFDLTEAQKRVLRDIRQDLRLRHPMRRLLQGDVGSGKTVVAACCALMALESGSNAVLMVPTELLATQHYATFKRWFTELGIGVELWTGNQKVKAGPSRSRVPIFTIGTHALFQSGFEIDRLGLVIIDEQHKFGVTQREQLVRKGSYPHLLIMTATPIPRTLGLTCYGDLDISIIDKPPVGRGEVKTYLRSADRLPKVWAFVREQLDHGRQAYLIYPRVEEDEGDTVKTVIAQSQRMAREFAPHRVGMLHGQLPFAERDRVMGAFRRGEMSVLVASSVIEVGIDVPNATIMVIEHAERFGLAQLHQLRGRIGRGRHQSYCILVADLRRPDARQRLEVLEQNTDGFAIAEADLRIRGPGEFLGQSQSGAPAFLFVDLGRDLDLVEAARGYVRSQEEPEKNEKPDNRSGFFTHGAENATPNG